MVKFYRLNLEIDIIFEVTTPLGQQCKSWETYGLDVMDEQINKTRNQNLKIWHGCSIT